MANTAALGTSGIAPIITSGIATFVGIVLAALSIFTMTQALSPAPEQSDAPLIVYGE